MIHNAISFTGYKLIPDISIGRPVPTLLTEKNMTPTSPQEDRFAVQKALDNIAESGTSNGGIYSTLIDDNRFGISARRLSDKFELIEHALTIVPDMNMGDKAKAQTSLVVTTIVRLGEKIVSAIAHVVPVVDLPEYDHVVDFLEHTVKLAKK